MGAGRLTNDGRNKRDRVEIALFALSATLLDLDEIMLRIRQAERRTALVTEVLGPAAVCVGRIRQDINTARQAMGDAWVAGPEMKWNDGQTDA